MKRVELSQVVDRLMNDARVEACIACELYSGPGVERHCLEGRIVDAEWHEHVGFWRCTFTIQSTSRTVAAQVDLHDNGTVHTMVFLPCQVTVSPSEGLMCLSLYLQTHEVLSGQMQ